MTTKPQDSTASTTGATSSAADLRQAVSSSALVAVETTHFRASRVDQGVGRQLPALGGTSARIETKFATHKPRNPPADAATFLVSGEIQYWPIGGGDEALAGIEVMLRLTYTFAGRTEPLSDEILEQFANQIALHHGWPFLRERVMSACQIIGAEPYVLPLRKLVG